LVIITTSEISYMAEKDKVIKSGQLTLPRLFFLAVVGGLIVAMVAIGGPALIAGYWIMTLAICVLLYLIAIDYGVHMEHIDLTGQPVQPTVTPDAAPTAEITGTAGSAAPVKRRSTSRPAKRRR
jgi:hypothetical protein